MSSSDLELQLKIVRIKKLLKAASTDITEQVRLCRKLNKLVAQYFRLPPIKTSKKSSRERKRKSYVSGNNCGKYS
jgi:hypothetical protein